MVGINKYQVFQVSRLECFPYATNSRFNNTKCNCNSINLSFPKIQSSLHIKTKISFSQRRKSTPIYYALFFRNSSPNHHHSDNHDDFLEAFVLTSETIRHHQLRRQGYLEETKWLSSGHVLPSPNESNPSVRSLGHGFLRRFPSPTIFLKIACNGDLLLPIIVGEFAIEKLVDAFRAGGKVECPSQFEFVSNLVATLGYKVKMIRITERVVNTYFARIYLSKPGEKAIISVDARPSDAINVAVRCKAPIYVSKQLVLSDAIKIAYGRWKGSDTKSVYDVSLDSAIEGPDLLAEELDLLTKMNTAVQDERYKDAAMWRDKLMQLRMPRHDV